MKINKNPKIAIACLVKTPQLTAVKTRLAKDIGQEKALRIYLSCIKQVKNLFDELKIDKEHNITPYFAVLEEKGLDNQLWQSYNSIYCGDNRELGISLANIYSDLQQKHDIVIIIASDSPDLDVALIDEAIKAIKKQNDIVIGPTFDGGFYLFAGAGDIARDIWLAVVYSRDDTRVELEKKLTEYKITHINILGDIDDESSFVNIKNKKFLLHSI